MEDYGQNYADKALTIALLLSHKWIDSQLGHIC
jgi:hypothetical protein